MKANFILIVFLLLLNSCFFIDDTYEVIGTVSINDIPVQGAAVSLGNNSTTTDSCGYFEISINKNQIGAYFFEVRVYGQGLSKTDSVDVYQNVDVGNINFIRTIDLRAVCDQSTGKAYLTWTRPENEQFLKYKVYRLRDNITTLVYTTNSVNDRTYSESVNIDITCYKVNVYSSTGIIDQSNMACVFFQPDPFIYCK